MIISASRRTDIPAFFSEWFFNRLKEGYAVVRNPRNNKLSRVFLTPELVDCIVFWTKNPAPMLPRLSELRDYSYYFQITLTGYDNDVECHLPDKRKVILPAMQELSKQIGPERVIWRYDPILVNDKYTMEYHLETFREFAEALNGYTEKCVFSFVDNYAKNSKALQRLGVKELSIAEQKQLASEMKKIADKYGMVMATCAEKINLEELGIQHNCCVDKELIERVTGGKFKTKRNLKDAGQREACGCIVSKEIGADNTCGNGCVYCYANFSPDTVRKRMALYDPASPILCDHIEEWEEIKDAGDQKRLVEIDRQLRFC